MKLARFALPLLVLAGSPFAVDARCVENLNQQAPAANALHETLLALAGEWEGQIEVHEANKTSASIISVSNRLSADKDRIDSCFEGFASGELFEGFAVLRADGNELASAWADSRHDDTVKTRGKSEPAERTFDLKGHEKDERDRTVQIRQVIRVVDKDNYVHEWHATRDGKDEVVLKFTMKRLPAKDRSTASARFNDKQFLEKYRPGVVAAVQSD